MAHCLNFRGCPGRLPSMPMENSEDAKKKKKNREKKKHDQDSDCASTIDHSEDADVRPREAFGYSERKASFEHRQRKTKTSHWLRSPGSPSLLVDMARQLSNGSWKRTVVRRRLVAQTGSGEEALSPKRTHPNHYNRYTSPSSYAPLKTINWLESWLPWPRCFAGSYERFSFLLKHAH